MWMSIQFHLGPRGLVPLIQQVGFYAEIVLPWLLTFLSFRDNAMLPSRRQLPGAPSFPGQVVTPTNGEEHISRRNIISL